MLRALAALVLLLLSLGARALEPGRALTQYSISAFGLEDGLPQSGVRTLAQTGDGYLWLGTYSGLARFNGTSFTVFDMNTTPELQSNGILALLVAKDGSLFIGTNGGGLVKRLPNGAFQRFGVGQGLSSESVYSLVEDRDGSLWLGTDGGGVCRFDGSRFTCFGRENGLPGDIVGALAVDGRGRVCAGTNRGGLACFQDGAFETRSAAGLATGGAVFALARGPDGALWAGTANGLFRLEGGDVRRYGTESGLPGPSVQRLFFDASGVLWVGLPSLGIGRLVGERFETMGVAQGLLNGLVWSFFEDREGSLWVGTSGGLNRLDAGPVLPIGTPEGLSDDFTRSVLEARDGALWVATSTGLNRVTRDGVKVYRQKDGLPGDTVVSLGEEPSGVLWVGTTRGLVRLEGGALRVFTISDGLPDLEVRAIGIAQDGSVWVGTRDGLAHLVDGKVVARVGPSQGLSHPHVLAIAEDGPGRLVVGTQGGGADLIEGDRVTRVMGKKEGLRSLIVLDAVADPDGGVWLPTDGGGLSFLRDGSLSTITLKSGLPVDKIFSLRLDGDRLWLTGTRGVFQLSRREVLDVLLGRSDRLTHVIDVGRNEGMRIAECVGTSQPASFVGRGGTLYVATLRGIAVIDPRRLLGPDLQAPPVRIEEALADGRPLALGGQVVLPPGAAEQIEVHYTGVRFRSPGRVRYRYRLFGHERAWVNAGPRRVATYGNLAPGDYRFEVQASVQGGLFGEEAATFSFRLEPRFYETTGFLVLLGLSGLVALCALAFGVHRLRMRSMRAREAELEAVVKERTERLREEKDHTQSALEEADAARREALADKAEAERLGQLAEEARRLAVDASRAKSSFLANMSHELRTPLNAIIGYSELLAEQLREEGLEQHLPDLGKISGAARHQVTLVNDILDLSKIEAGRMELEVTTFDLAGLLWDVAYTVRPLVEKNGNRLDVRIDDLPKTLTSDPTRVRQVLLNLLSNAAKFTENGEVRFEARVAGGVLELRVADSGIGMSREELSRLFLAFTQADSSTTRRYGGTGLGLVIARRLAQLMGGDVHVVSEKGVGTTFTFGLPLGGPSPGTEGGHDVAIG